MRKGILSRAVMVLSVGILVAGLRSPLTPAIAQSQSEVHFSFTGAGQVTVEPDFAVVVFAIQGISRTAQGAIAENGAGVEALLRHLRTFVRPGDRIETSGFRLGQSRGGFFALTDVQVRTTQVKEVGRLIDLAIRGGADEVSSVGFGRENTKEAGQQAVREALQRARENADAVAAGLGLHSVRIISIEPSLERLEGPMVVRSAEVSKGRDVQIQPGLLTITARVTVRFVLSP